MARYKKRADGRYAANVVVGYDEETGKRLYAPTIYAKSIPELERRKADILSDLNKGTYSNDMGLTLAEWADKWLETYKRGNVSQNTFHGYQNILKNHITSIRNIRLKDLTKTDLQRIINELSGHHDLQRRFKITINQILESAIDDGLVYKNVSRNLELPTKPKSDKRALTQFEKDAIAKADFSLKQKAFVTLLLYTGIRRGEAMALMKSDIDFKNKNIRINKSLEFTSNKSAIKSTKTAAGNRVVDILSPLESVLTEYYNTVEGLYLFPNQSGQPMSKMSYRRFWEGIYLKINKGAGGKHSYEKGSLVIEIDAIKGLTPHIFRHNFATTLYYAEVDVKEAQRILGHADVKTTLDIYTHLDKQKSKSKSKLENYIAL